MAKTDTDMIEHSSRFSRKPLLLSISLALLGGGIGFYVVQADLLKFPESMSEGANSTVPALPDVRYIPLDPLVISLRPDGGARHLRFTAQLEVPTTHLAEVELLRPRVIDVLNGFLRAVEPNDLEGPAALTRLRAQMLRRVRIVVGEGRIRDLLIMEFILS
jgi:flagellar protein FliL